MTTDTGFTPQELDVLDLAVAATLLLISAGVSVVYKLGINRSLVIATVRMVAQLALIGLVLQYLFAVSNPFLVGLVAVVMLGFAGYEIAQRQTRKFKGFWTYGLGAGTMTLAAVLVTVFALSTQLRPDPWWEPRYVIPILGMILGNVLTGVSLGLSTFLNTVARERHAIEARLALGHTKAEALSTQVQDALRQGLMPIINSMAATGVVALPGMMTGQILAGADPVQAVKYQLLIMFLIGAATTLGVIMAVFGALYRITDARHRLRLDRLKSTEP